GVPMTIEGCDFDGRRANDFLTGGGAPWEFRNCRLWTMGGFNYTGPRLRLSDCLLLCDGYAINFGPKSEAELVNCLVRVCKSGGGVLTWGGGGQLLRLHGCRFYQGTGREHTLGLEGEGEPVTVEAVGNLFHHRTRREMIGGPNWRQRLR